MTWHFSENVYPDAYYYNHDKDKNGINYKSRTRAFIRICYMIIRSFDSNLKWCIALYSFLGQINRDKGLDGANKSSALLR